MKLRNNFIYNMKNIKINFKNEREREEKVWMFLKEIKECLTNWKISHINGLEELVLRLLIDSMQYLLKIPNFIFAEIEKLILKLFWRYKWWDGWNNLEKTIVEKLTFTNFKIYDKTSIMKNVYCANLDKHTQCNNIESWK